MILKNDVISLSMIDATCPPQIHCNIKWIVAVDDPFTASRNLRKENW